jgi:hypothetical protein
MEWRQGREHPAVWWAGFAGLGVGGWLLGSRLDESWQAEAWRAALLLLLLWCLYQFCLVPTVCRVRTRQGFSCAEPVRGRLYACTAEHQEVKNDALWRLVGLRNPFRGAEQPDPNRTTGTLVVSPPVRARLGQMDQIMIGLAAAGTLVAIAGAVGGYL